MYYKTSEHKMNFIQIGKNFVLYSSIREYIATCYILAESRIYEEVKHYVL